MLTLLIIITFRHLLFQFEDIFILFVNFFKEPTGSHTGLGNSIWMYQTRQQMCQQRQKGHGVTLTIQLTQTYLQP